MVGEKQGRVGPIRLRKVYLYPPSEEGICNEFNILHVTSNG